MTSPAATFAAITYLNNTPCSQANAAREYRGHYGAASLVVQ